MGTFVISNFGMRHVASQRFVSRKSSFLCFFEPYCNFSYFFWNKKDAQHNLAKIGPYESPWTPEFDNLVQFWIMSVQNKPRLSWSLRCSRHKAKTIPKLYWEYSKHISNYIQHISKHIQDIDEKWKIPSGSRPGPSPGPRTGRPGTARPCASAGPATAWYFAIVFYIFDLSWTYLDIPLVYLWVNMFFFSLGYMGS